MEEILKKLQELCQECQATIGSYRDALQKVKEQSTGLEAKRKKLDAQAQDLEARLVIIKGQESRLLRHDQLDQKAADHEEKGSILAHERQTFEKQKADALKEIEDKKSFNEHWAKKLQEGQAALDKERRTYKADVIAAVAADEERKKALKQG